jgi:putative endonuclease
MRSPNRATVERMPREYRFYVYMVQSASRRALYIGMTNNLHRRIFEHKHHCAEGFTDDYNAVRLVYWESYDDVYKAIAREKQLKNWRREKKLWLIARLNAGWKDLAADWGDNIATQSTKTGSCIRGE